jgi:hypothetical protein
MSSATPTGSPRYSNRDNLILSIRHQVALKIGGVVLTQSHQTWPRHDAPWDFFRFSASSWGSLFCDATGFRIVQAADDMLALIPVHFMGDPNLELSDQPAFLVSICVAEKIGDPRVRWDADPDYRGLGNTQHSRNASRSA